MKFFYAYHSPKVNNGDFIVEGGYGVKREYVHKKVNLGDFVFIIQKTKKSEVYELCGLYVITGHYVDHNSPNPYRFNLELVKGGKPWIKLDENEISKELKQIDGITNWSNFKRHFCMTGATFRNPLEKYVIDCLSSYLPEITKLSEHDSSTFDPSDIDRRSLVYRQIRERRGQKKFREALFKRYGKKCLVTGCEITDVLEAAHISWYRGEEDNHIENGLVLRADIHTLFDLNLIGIHPDTLNIILSDSVKKEYSEVCAKKILISSTDKPSKAALSERYKEFLDSKNV